MSSESFNTRGKKAKKITIACEFLIFFLFVAKILALGGVIQKVEKEFLLFPLSQANADLSASPGGLPVRDVLDDNLANEKKLMDHLMERQKELEARENLLMSEEKKLDGLKQEIVAKIENLRILEEKLSIPLAAEEKKFQDLAKVYESTPPEQIAAILEKMDTQMAAAIISNMNNKKAGRVLAHLSSTKAVDIAKEAANYQKSP